ncbi:MAG: cytochrome c maturation protein CcmE [Acidimicrobiales bacterium]
MTDSTDPAELDLTPRQSPPPKPGRSWRNWVIMGTLAVVAGFVLYQALTSARVFFLNVDEAVAQRQSLGDDTFQIQGTVVSEPEATPEGALLFTISFGGADADVRHVGNEPSSLFKFGERVVAKGRWDGETFESSQVVVKHSEEYVEDNPSRVDYELDETAPEAG